MPASAILEVLASARRVADYAEGLGIELRRSEARPTSDHIGAVLADAVLQAGLNYRTVVKTRIDRIITRYPTAKTLQGVKEIIDSGLTSDFLLWKHPTKITRFNTLASFFALLDIEDTSDLKRWLIGRTARAQLLSLKGIGPKTYDYMCCLTGIDCIAVDRHIRAFTRQAGLEIYDYEELKTVVSYAADLLGVSRREFDAWIWISTSRSAASSPEHKLI